MGEPVQKAFGVYCKKCDRRFNSKCSKCNGLIVETGQGPKCSLCGRQINSISHAPCKRVVWVRELPKE